MAYFERVSIKSQDGEPVNPAKEEGLVLLRRIFQALRPLGMVTGSGSNRLSVDVNTVGSGNINITGINGGTITNFTNIGGVTAFEHMKAVSRQAYNSGPRSRVS